MEDTHTHAERRINSKYSFGGNQIFPRSKLGFIYLATQSWRAGARPPVSRDGFTAAVSREPLAGPEQTRLHRERVIFDPDDREIEIARPHYSPSRA